MNAALGAVFGEYEPDEIAQRAQGVRPGGGRLHALGIGALEPTEPGEWLDAPFDQADPELAICRFDVSAVFEDDLSMLDQETDRDRPGLISIDRRGPARDRRGPRRPAARRLRVRPRPCPHAPAQLSAASSLSTGPSLVVRSLAAGPATARARPCSAPCTTDRCRSPRAKAV